MTYVRKDCRLILTFTATLTNGFPLEHGFKLTKALVDIGDRSECSPSSGWEARIPNGKTSTSCIRVVVACSEQDGIRNSRTDTIRESFSGFRSLCFIDCPLSDRVPNQMASPGR